MNSNTVVGVFESAYQARQALEELRHAGFSDEHLGVIARDAAVRKEVMAKAGAAVGSGWIPDEQTQYYEGEVKTGRILLTVNAEGRVENAQKIIRRCGGTTKVPVATTV